MVAYYKTPTTYLNMFGSGKADELVFVSLHVDCIGVLTAQESLISVFCSRSVIYLDKVNRRESREDYLTSFPKK